MDPNIQQFNYYFSILNRECPHNKEKFQNIKIDSEKISIFDNIIQILDKYNESINDINKEYIRLSLNHFKAIYDKLPYRKGIEYNHPGPSIEVLKKNFYEKIYQPILEYVEALNFHINFYEKIGNFDSNIVLIGANGSGKSSLSIKFKEYLNDNGIVISAQRTLLLPNFDSISNPSFTVEKLKQEQLRDKTYKSKEAFRYINGEFEVVIKHLLAENNTSSNKYRNDAVKSSMKGEIIKAPPSTNLDKTLKIWNSLISHRILVCEDGINLFTSLNDHTNHYPSIQMSDGEKVLLYLIAQVLLAPKNGFIVIDEPEIYLHKTILKRLWDILETERHDCVFIYLTHDLDFATSRNTAKKLWIKSYIHPDTWEIEKIESEDIPEALLYELIGSRKNILFCEGEKGSLDEKLYSLIFPDFTISPVGSCFNVINHTKAFNKLKNSTTKAFGIIDSDHHSSERLISLHDENIFNFSVSEVENLFLDEHFLELFANAVYSDVSKINKIKEDVIAELMKGKELQISNYVSAKINNIFTDTDLSKGNSLDKIKTNYDSFLSLINIDEFYKERESEIDEIISTNNYSKAISVFNNKGLKKIAIKHLGVTDFTKRCFRILSKDQSALDLIKKYFPEELLKVDKDNANKDLVLTEKKTNMDNPFRK